MGMALMDMTKRALMAEADLALKENARRGLALSLEHAEAELAENEAEFEILHAEIDALNISVADLAALKARAGKETP
jgi:uncharacterized protein (DUF924 family)